MTIGTQPGLCWTGLALIPPAVCDGRVIENGRWYKIIKTRGHFPSDDAASKLIWLALRNITADWGKPAHHWKEAMNQFAILYADRFTRDA